MEEKDKHEGCGVNRMGNTCVLVVCVLAIVFIETVALMNGIDGKLLAIAIGAIAGLGGYTLPKIFNIRMK